MKKYDEVAYWNERKNPSAKRIDKSTPYHLEYIEEQLVGCDKVLECGPGVGRIFPAYKNIKILECFDITNQHRNTLVRAAQQYDFEFNLTTKKVVGELPYAYKEFDAAVVCEVLLHQRPENIIKVMSELIRVSKKVIAISWTDEHLPPLTNSGEHCFNYIYPDICKENEWRIFNVKKTSRFSSSEGELIYFCYEEEK
jgi:hypothetical protein